MGMADTGAAARAAARPAAPRAQALAQAEGRVDHIEQRHLFGQGGITTGGHGRRF
jgi:hypothetical protein